jgi:large subunit ribosomal protein L6
MRGVVMSPATENASAQRQSRIGKRPIVVPAGVTATVKGVSVTVKGPKGSSERSFSDKVAVTLENGALVVKVLPSAPLEGPRLQGLTWALLKNMVQGVSKGYALSLDLVGVGYRAELKGQSLTLALGLSHPVSLVLPNEIKARVETIDEGGTKKPRLHLESHDKELLSQIAAKIRSFRPPEPYKGKGVRFTGEKVRMKAGKAGGKGGKK